MCSLINGQFPDSCFKLARLLHVGEELRFELKAISAISIDQVDIQGAVEPGVPIGMDFADSISAPGQGTKTRAVVWTPRPGQQGKMHIASFLSLILPEETQGVSCPLYFRRMNIQIQVQAYQSFWQIPRMTDTKLIVSKPVNRVDAGRFGPEILFSVSSGQQIEGVELRCFSDVATQFSYAPSITLHNVSVDGKLIEGHCDKSSCSSPSELAGWGGFGDMKRVPSYPGNELSFEFKYKSVIRLDEGSEKRWCFSCTDSGAMNAPAIQCITVRTRLCEVCKFVCASLCGKNARAVNLPSSRPFYIVRLVCYFQFVLSQEKQSLLLIDIVEMCVRDLVTESFVLRVFCSCIFRMVTLWKASHASTTWCTFQKSAANLCNPAALTRAWLTHEHCFRTGTGVACGI